MFCKDCGKEMVHFANLTQYSDKTGQPLYALWLYCVNEDCDSFQAGAQNKRLVKSDVSEEEARLWMPETEEERNTMKNKGCAIQIFLGILLVLILTQCSCMAPAALPTVAVTVEGVNKGVIIHTPPAPTPELVREVCPHVGNVNLRKAANAESDILAVLKTGDTVTVTGGFVQSPDGGVWYPVKAGGLTGYTNARYLCE